MISVNNISIHFTGENLFEDVSFIINDRDRAGLVGKNGVGKTTLLRIIAGLQEPEKGGVVIPAGRKTGYLPQEITISSKKTVFDEALTAFAETLQLDAEIKKIGHEITSRSDHESPAYLKLIDRLTELNEQFAMLGGHTMNADTEKVLLGLGFEPSDFSRLMTEFSGGWQMRVELAKILLQKPELLLLDEPTNHLDIESIQWLEQFLDGYPGAVILVSHDRAFLDNVTERTIEINLGKIYDYKACYSDYIVLREEQREQQIATYTNQQRQIQQVERFVNRFRYKATKARQVQSRLKMLEKMDKVEVDEQDLSTIHFGFPPAPHSGKQVFEAGNLTKKYSDKLVLRELEFIISRGEKIAFVGRNGEGKTTLAKIIVGLLEHQGTAKLGHQVSIGYYAQNQAEMLDPNKTVFETLDNIAVGEVRTKIRNILGSFLFSGEDIDKKVKVLSGGEKSRLALASLLLEPVNLLVLDEPTNHLDMRSKDILKNALLRYDGTLIVVSHDRDFLQGLTSKVFEFRNHGIRQYLGDIYDFLDSRKLESLKELEKAAKSPRGKNKEKALPENKINYERKKQLDRDIRKLSGLIEKCEVEISRLEDELKQKTELLSNPGLYQGVDSLENIYQEYDSLKSGLEKQMELWEKLHLQIEELKTTV